MGKDVFMQRINSVFSKFLKKSVSTKMFITELIKNKKNHPYYEKFFENWIYSRKIPTIDYRINLENNTASITFEQQNSDFVFPLKIIINTKTGEEVRTFIIKDKKQLLVIKMKNFIDKIRIDKGFSPIFLKKQMEVSE